MRVAKLMVMLGCWLALVWGLTGCVNVAQEIELNPDLSGKLTFDIAVSETVDTVAAQQVKDLIALFDTMSKLDIKETSLTNTFTTDEYTRDGNKHYVYTLGTNNLQVYLAVLQTSLSKAGIAMSIEKLDNRNLLFKQTIDMSKADTIAIPKLLLDPTLKGYEWTLRMKVPNVVQTNGAYDAATETVTWRVPMAEIYGNQVIEMTVEFKQPFKMEYLYLIGGALLALLVAVVVVLVLRRKKKASLEPPLEDDLATPLEF